ncbi:MAG TPA: hypothetical protein VMC43_03115 [Candidatus Paceibacterota bacterium]|nr:hypothetical protein [Candidatus Paceibacterota bacterium]
MKLRFDEDRARQLFGILQDFHLDDRKRGGPFRNIVLPQDRWAVSADPRRAANELSYFAITQRGGVVSEDPGKWIVTLRETEPDLFEPAAVARAWTVDGIMEAIRTIIVKRRKDLGLPKFVQLSLAMVGQSHADLLPEQVNGANEDHYKLDEFAESWHYNSVTLAELWDSNVLNIYAGAQDFEEAFARIDRKRVARGFLGIRRKIFSLLTIWLQEQNFVPRFPTPVPVDFHALRLLFGTGVVTAEDVPPFVVDPDVHPTHFAGRPFIHVSEEVMDEVAIWSQGFMVRNGFSHLAINPALWVLSRELCVHEFQAGSNGRGRTGNRRNLKIVYAEDLRRNPALWRKRYRDPARFCPVAGLCQAVTPSALYYSFGLLFMNERLPYPFGRPRFLPNINWRDFLEHQTPKNDRK